MKFALLGSDADALAVARAVAESTEHELVHICQAGDWAAQLKPHAPQARVSDDWEALLDTHAVGAVIVARGPDEDLRIEQLRKLIATGAALVVSHPLLESVLDYYELEMMRQESGASVLPYAPARWHPGFDGLCSALAADDDGPIGRVEQIIFERAQKTRSKPAVREAFIRDADLLRVLCGELTKLAAMSPQGSQSFENLGIQLSGPGDILARWSIGPVETRPGGVLTLRGAHGQAVLRMPGGDEPWQLELVVGQETRSQSFPAWDPAAAALAHLDKMQRGETVHPDLMDAIRTMELAESIQRSLARGRTVELNVEEQTEHNAFRATMASVGCAALGGVFVMGLLALLLATVSDTFRRALAFWPYLAALVLGLFLLMQLLALVLPREEER